MPVTLTHYGPVVCKRINFLNDPRAFPDRWTCFFWLFEKWVLSIYNVVLGHTIEYRCRLAPGWRRVGAGLAPGWRRVGAGLAPGWCRVGAVLNGKVNCKCKWSSYDSCKIWKCATNQPINHIYISKLWSKTIQIADRLKGLSDWRVNESWHNSVIFDTSESWTM